MAEGTWIDAFVTKPAKDEADAMFMGSVMSVVPVKAGGQSDWDILEIRDESTVWITPRWIAGTEVDYYDGSAVYNDFLNMQQGDQVYIGHNLGATNVRTILERRVGFGKLHNQTGGAITLSPSSAAGSDVLGDGSYTSGTLPLVAYRIDAPINATKLPDAGGNYTAKTDYGAALTLANQNDFSFPDDSMQTSRYDSNKWCPLYRISNLHLDSRLILHLDHGVKAVHCVKLIAYSSNNKTLPGYLHYHEFAHDDYVMLGIKELPASLVSNESTARGAFAALHISDTGETYEREPAGIATQYINLGASNIRQLTLELTNRKGEPAHLGRLHLWFKLLVTHG